MTPIPLSVGVELSRKYNIFDPLLNTAAALSASNFFAGAVDNFQKGYVPTTEDSTHTLYTNISVAVFPLSLQYLFLFGPGLTLEAGPVLGLGAALSGVDSTKDSIICAIASFSSSTSITFFPRTFFRK